MEIKGTTALVTGANRGIGRAFTQALLSHGAGKVYACLLYTSPSPRDRTRSRMPSSA